MNSPQVIRGNYTKNRIHFPHQHPMLNKCDLFLHKGIQD